MLVICGDSLWGEYSWCEVSLDDFLELGGCGDEWTGGETLGVSLDIFRACKIGGSGGGIYNTNRNHCNRCSEAWCEGKIYLRSCGRAGFVMVDFYW